jgi:hypothetical protein
MYEVSGAAQRYRNKTLLKSVVANITSRGDAVTRDSSVCGCAELTLFPSSAGAGIRKEKSEEQVSGFCTSRTRRRHHGMELVIISVFEELF